MAYFSGWYVLAVFMQTLLQSAFFDSAPSNTRASVFPFDLGISLFGYDISLLCSLGSFGKLFESRRGRLATSRCATDQLLTSAQGNFVAAEVPYAVMLSRYADSKFDQYAFV